MKHSKFIMCSILINIWLLSLMIWGFYDTYIKYKYSPGWFWVSVSFVLIFNIFLFRDWGAKQ